MKPEEQRIAIAEACGFKKVGEIFAPDGVRWASPRRYFWPPDADYGNKLPFKNQHWGWDKLPDWNKDASPDFTGVPDYLNDLNAMAKAEKILSHEVKRRGGVSERSSYAMQLEHILCGPADRYGEYDNTPDSFDLIHALASQKAEAFLQTLDLWK